MLKSHANAVPVVVIGNIVVGGTGKTPLLIAICRYLKSMDIDVGVVSRGYGGTADNITSVNIDDEATKVGDEPLMIHRNTGVPVVIGADRSAAVAHLTQNNDVDIILSDDGLQHYRMQRQFEIAVIDSSRGFGNGFCLPAGPLREPIRRLNDVDMLVYNNTDESEKYPLSFTLVPDRCINLKDNTVCRLSELAGRRLHAIAGIGNPQRFFDTLRENGLTIIEHPFPDHHVYKDSDFSGWQDECIIMTEKDAVKCQLLELTDAWSLNVTARLSDELESKLSHELTKLLTAQAEDQ